MIHKTKRMMLHFSLFFMKGKQQGFALILTMVMLAVLSLLGIMVLNSTDTELSITSNYRISSESFTAADVVMEYSLSHILNNRTALDLTDNSLDSILSDLLPPGVSLIEGGINEIDFYTGAMPRRLASRFSVDMTGKGNVYRTTPSGSGGVMPYYRTTVETIARERSVSRLESVQIDMTGGL